ncbi:MAG: Bax inhibitor-1 family protein [archaeon]|nr:Bax inhibitor-1 family protein [archaeon]
MNDSKSNFSKDNKSFDFNFDKHSYNPNNPFNESKNPSKMGDAQSIDKNISDLENSINPNSEKDFKQMYTEDSKLNFIANTFIILTIQQIYLLFLISISYIPPYKLFLLSDSGTIMAFVFFVLFSFFLFLTICKRELYSSSPIKYILLFLYITSLGLFIEKIITALYLDWILYFWTMLCISTAAMGVYTFFTYKDNSCKSNICFCSLVLLVSVMLFCVFFNSAWKSIIYSSFGVFVYIIYLAVEFQIINNNFGNSYKEDDSVIASLDAYIDQFNAIHWCFKTENQPKKLME